VAARILDAYRGFAWPQRAVTISVGLAQSARGDDAADLVRRADAALYAAKHAGRNRLEAAEVAPARATAAEA
jgi:PleD family two-component response regulator